MKFLIILLSYTIQFLVVLLTIKLVFLLMPIISFAQIAMGLIASGLLLYGMMAK